MVCEKVAKMTLMRHNNLATAFSAAEYRYRALAGKKGMVEYQRWGNIVAVLPRLELAAVDVMVAHARLQRRTLLRLPIQLSTLWQVLNGPSGRASGRVFSDHAAFRFVPFAVEMCGYMGKEAVKFVNRLGDIVAEIGRIPRGAFVHWEMQLLSVTVQRGEAEMYRRSGLFISREQGLCYDVGFAVPVLMS